jgi:hypothetical protein
MQAVVARLFKSTESTAALHATVQNTQGHHGIAQGSDGDFRLLQEAVDAALGWTVGLVEVNVRKLKLLAWTAAVNPGRRPEGTHGMTDFRLEWNAEEFAWNGLNLARSSNPVSKTDSRKHPQNRRSLYNQAGIDMEVAIDSLAS